MKGLLCALLILAPVICRAGDRLNPAAYTITVHVQSSRVTGENSNIERLSVTIDGKKYRLQAFVTPVNTVLRVGDYKARIAREDTSKSYEYLREYEFLLPDGKTRRYTVVGEDE